MSDDDATITDVKKNLLRDYGIICLVFSEDELRFNEDDVLCWMASERILEEKRKLSPLTDQELKDIAAQIEEAKKTDKTWLRMTREAGNG